MVFAVVYVALMASFASPALFIISGPLTYLAVRSWSRDRRARRDREQATWHLETRREQEARVAAVARYFR